MVVRKGRMAKAGTGGKRPRAPAFHFTQVHIHVWSSPALKKYANFMKRLTVSNPSAQEGGMGKEAEWGV